MKPAWRPPQLSDFAEFVEVTAFDPSLSHCAVVVLVIKNGYLHIRDREVLEPPAPAAGGFLGTFERTVALSQMVASYPWLDSYFSAGAYLGRATVFEMPSVVGHRTESSMMAGYAIYENLPSAIMVSAMHVHAVLAGKKREAATAKREIREAVERYGPETRVGGWNEHTRDALATGLTYLYDLRQKELADAR